MDEDGECPMEKASTLKQLRPVGGNMVDEEALNGCVGDVVADIVVEL